MPSLQQMVNRAANRRRRYVSQSQLSRISNFKVFPSSFKKGPHWKPYRAKNTVSLRKRASIMKNFKRSYAAAKIANAIKKRKIKIQAAFARRKLLKKRMYPIR